jgi:hypothetical protein
MNEKGPPVQGLRACRLRAAQRTGRLADVAEPCRPERGAWRRREAKWTTERAHTGLPMVGAQRTRGLQAQHRLHLQLAYILPKKLELRSGGRRARPRRPRRRQRRTLRGLQRPKVALLRLTERGRGGASGSVRGADGGGRCREISSAAARRHLQQPWSRELRSGGPSG